MHNVFQKKSGAYAVLLENFINVLEKGVVVYNRNHWLVTKGSDV